MVTEQDVRQAIGSVIDRIDSGSIGRETDFYDCDLDSLDHAHIILRLEELYGLKVADGDFDECCSIAAIIDYAQRLERA